MGTEKTWFNKLLNGWFQALERKLEHVVVGISLQIKNRVSESAIA